VSALVELDISTNLTSIKSKSERDKVGCAREEPHNVTKKGSAHFDGINMINLLYVPTLKHTLVSVKSVLLTKLGNVVMFDGDSCWIVDNMKN
jgi:hypothetical protein